MKNALVKYVPPSEPTFIEKIVLQNGDLQAVAQVQRDIICRMFGLPKFVINSESGNKSGWSQAYR